MNEKIKEQLLKELGLTGLAPAEQDQALEKVGGLIFQSIFLRVAEQLEDEKRKELEALFTTPTTNPELLLTFLKTNVANFDEIVKQEVERFKHENAAMMQ